MTEKRKEYEPSIKYHAKKTQKWSVRLDWIASIYEYSDTSANECPW